MPQAGFEPTEAGVRSKYWNYTDALPPSHHGWVRIRNYLKLISHIFVTYNFATNVKNKIESST